MANVLTRMSTETSMYVTITGYEQVGKTKSPFSSIISLKFDTAENQPVVLIEFRNYVNGNMVQRVVGDGYYMWDNRVTNNTYLCSQYGNVDSAQPSNYRKKAFEILRLRTSGPAAYVARQLSEAFADPSKLAGYSQTWLPWLTTAPIESCIEGFKCASADGRENLLYNIVPEDPETRSTWLLSGTTYQKTTPAGSSQKTIWWDARFSYGQVAKDVNFGFIPPKGAKPISSAISGG